jgi:hypothetical protein
MVGVTLEGQPTPDAAHAGCSTTDGNPVITVHVPSQDLPVSIAGGATQSIDLADGAAMDPAATTSCQGATFTVPITVTVEQ